ncbi:hypothetical protein TNCV_3399061 [Trichonephila clavipes]|nr:hypothetical protein TNCV_3399061 [Trichonephila clavipes]
MRADRLSKRISSHTHPGESWEAAIIPRTSLKGTDAYSSSYLTTSNDSGASIGAARQIRQQFLNNSLTPLILSMGRRCETCLAGSQGDHIPY